VVEHDGVVFEKLRSLARKAAAEFCLVPRADPHEHRLVVALGLVVIDLPLIKRMAAPAARAFAPVGLRLAARDADETHEPNLRIIFQRALEKLVFPIWRAT